MIARLGEVLYWFGCGLAALLVAGAVLAYFNRSGSDGPGVLARCTVGAVLIWLAGRAILYVLAAR